MHAAQVFASCLPPGLGRLPCANFMSICDNYPSFMFPATELPPAQRDPTKSSRLSKKIHDYTAGARDAVCQGAADSGVGSAAHGDCGSLGRTRLSTRLVTVRTLKAGDGLVAVATASCFVFGSCFPSRLLNDTGCRCCSIVPVITQGPHNLGKLHGVRSDKLSAILKVGYSVRYHL